MTLSLEVERQPLPYLVHTNRELGLMLRGEKPLARFARELSAPVPVLERYFRMFDRHVAEGRFVKRTVMPYPKAPFQSVYYALPGEEWRIDAMIELLSGDGWTLADERREGELLGYSDWQNNIWIERYGATRVAS